MPVGPSSGPPLSNSSPLHTSEISLVTHMPFATMKFTILRRARRTLFIWFLFNFHLSNSTHHPKWDLMPQPCKHQQPDQCPTLSHSSVLCPAGTPPPFLPSQFLFKSHLWYHLYEPDPPHLTPFLCSHPQVLTSVTVHVAQERVSSMTAGTLSDLFTGEPTACTPGPQEALISGRH